MTIHYFHGIRAIPVLFCLLLSGMPQIYAQSNPQPRPASVPADGTDTDTWKDIFGDPLLDTIIRKAVANNYNVQNAVNNIQMAKAKLRMQQSGFYPTIDLTGGYTLEKTSLGIEHIDQRDNIGEALISTNWEIDIFGSIRKGAKAQKQFYLASREQYRGVMVSLIAELSTNYINLRKYQTALQIAKQNLSSQQKLMELTETKYQAGLTSQLDAAQSKSLYLQTKANIPGIETAITSQINAIITLTGERSEELYARLNSPSPLPEGKSLPVAGLPGELIRRRPDVLAAEKTMEGMASAAGATKSDWWPKFYVSGNFGYGSKDFRQFTNNDNMTWQVNPSMKWTIFSGREKVQATRNAMLQLDEAINNYNNTLLTAIEEIDNAVFAYNRSLLQLSAQQEAVEQIRITFGLAADLYEKGLSDYQNVLDAQKNMLGYENTLINAKSSTLLNFIQLYKALGGSNEINK